MSKRTFQVFDCVKVSKKTLFLTFWSQTFVSCLEKCLETNKTTINYNI